MSYSHNDVQQIVQLIMEMIDEDVMNNEGYNPGYSLEVRDNAYQGHIWDRKITGQLEQIRHLLKRRAPVRDVMALVNLLTLERKSR